MSASQVLRAKFCTAVACATLAAGAAAGTFYEKDGAAIKGYDPVAYFTEGKPVKGTASNQADYKGSTFYFASPSHREAFVADPARYAPQYGGFCAYGAAGGYKAAVDPAAFTIVDGKLYLNYDAGVQKQWSGDIPGFVAKADRNWPTVSTTTKVFE